MDYNALLISVIQVLLLQFVSSHLTVKTSPTGDYVVMVGGQQWLQSDSTFLRSQHKIWTTENDTLKICGSISHGFGEDMLGRWHIVKYGYKQKEASSCVMNVSIKSYSERNIVVFSQTFPVGLHNTSSGDMNAVVTSYPSFGVEGDGSLGLLAFGGLFNYMGTTVQRFRKGLNLTDGMESGPVVLFDKNGQAIVISPYSKFMTSSMLYDRQREGFHWGVMGKAASIPANFTMETLMYYSSQGINKAISEWGETLQMWYKKSKTYRNRDLTISHIGYYTDNGAFYYHNLQYPFKNYEQMLLAIAGEKKTPYRYLQYDDWWYYILGPGYGATVRWEPMPEIFPHGLQYIYNKTGLPVLAHNRFWSSTTPYAKKNGGKFDFITYQRLAIPIEERFWEWLFGEAKRWGMVTYEQDWLNYQTERIFQLHSDVKLSDLWLKQMGQAAANYNMTIQYCMALPRHILQSVEIPTVTQVRVSADYAYDGQWRIGISSMLASAVGLAPFKDTFYSSKNEPGNPYNKTENNPLLEALVSILSTGPVAPGDGYNFSNTDLIKRLHRLDGLLLKPGRPTSAIDAQIIELAFDDGSGPKGEVWSTYTDINRLRFGIIFAADLKNPYHLGPTLAGFGPQELQTVAYSYSSPSDVVEFSDKYPLKLENCPSTQPCLWYTSPVLTHSGRKVVLLGELDKLIPMSPQRVHGWGMSASDIMILVSGVHEETVDFSVSIDFIQKKITCSGFGKIGLAIIYVMHHYCRAL